jgi:hypothetical protein
VWHPSALPDMAHKTPLHLVLGVLAIGVLVAVFMLYTQPDFMLQMANQIWACF